MNEYYKLKLINTLASSTENNVEIEKLQKKLDIATKALVFYKNDMCSEPYISRIATETLKEIDLVGTSAKEKK
jgi:hypothetical protein